MLGDYNSVRSEAERSGSVFVERDAESFNDFINNMELVEVPLVGRRFTWFGWGNKISKLDRVLASPDWLAEFNCISCRALSRGTSDHCPLLLDDGSLNFGPKPFKAFDSWWNNPVFANFVSEEWEKLNQSNGTMKNKLFRLEGVLRQWNKDVMGGDF